MNCDDVRSSIYVYLDGEFAAPEAMDFRDHLATCPACRALAERESGFLDELKDRIETPPMPPEVRTRIESSLAAVAPDVRRSAPGRKVFWRVALPATLAATIALAWVFYRDRVAVPPVEVVDVVTKEAVRAHTNDLPMEVRGSDEHIRTFVQENVPFAVEIPFSDREDVKLVGARLTQMDGRSAVIFKYETADGERLSVLQHPEGVARHQVPDAEVVAGDVNPQVGAVDGYRVVTYRDRGLTNAVVGRVTESKMLRLVPAGFQRRRR